VRVRLAAWGAAALAVNAVSYLPPIRETVFHSILSLFGFAGYLLLSFDPPVRTRLQFRFLVAGAIVGVAGFLAVSQSWHVVAHAFGSGCAVAFLALPLWLFARSERFVFVAAGAVAVAAKFLDGTAGELASYAGFGAAALATALCAMRLANPGGTVIPARKPPRMVWGRDIMTLTDDQKAQRLAALDARFEAGEIPEHVYWDRRQEIESR
jgi:hypothetical protein